MGSSSQAEPDLIKLVEKVTPTGCKERDKKQTPSFILCQQLKPELDCKAKLRRGLNGIMHQSQPTFALRDCCVTNIT